MAGNWGDDVWGEYPWGYDEIPPEPVGPGTCFAGPLTTLEAALLDPLGFTGGDLAHTEQLRQLLLDAAISVPDPVAAIRSLYQRLYNTDVAVMLRRLIAEPSAQERASYICYKRTQLAIFQELQTRPLLCDQSLDELNRLGLPKPYVALLEKYLQVNQPNDRVPVAIILVFLAKILETGALV